jgi:hypothetical protein
MRAVHADLEVDAVVEEGGEALARRELPALVLLLDARFPAHLLHLGPAGLEVLDEFSHVHGITSA